VFKRARPRKKTIVPTFLVQTQAQKFTPISSNGELLYRPKDVERITSMFYLLSKTKKENESTTLPMCVVCFIPSYVTVKMGLGSLRGGFSFSNESGKLHHD